MLAEEVAFVLGVDTHADAHCLALIEAKTQRMNRCLTIPASRRGYRQALRLARRQAPGRRVWALEGSGSYGAGLARFLSQQGEHVLEVERSAREGRRGRLKSDSLDAERAARQVLAGSAGAAPRFGQETQALRALLSTREGAVRACTAALNELRALVVTSPPELREHLQERSEAALIGACARLRPGRSDSERAIALALRSLALRVRQLRAESETLERELVRRIEALAPALIARRGVGPISAAALLVAWSEPGRLRSARARATSSSANPSSTALSAAATMIGVVSSDITAPFLPAPRPAAQDTAVTPSIGQTPGGLSIFKEQARPATRCPMSRSRDHHP